MNKENECCIGTGNISYEPVKCGPTLDYVEQFYMNREEIKRLIEENEKLKVALLNVSLKLR